MGNPKKRIQRPASNYLMTLAGDTSISDEMSVKISDVRDDIMTLETKINTLEEIFKEVDEMQSRGDNPEDIIRYALKAYEDS